MDESFDDRFIGLLIFFGTLFAGPFVAGYFFGAGGALAVIAVAIGMLVIYKSEDINKAYLVGATLLAAVACFFLTNPIPWILLIAYIGGGIYYQHQQNRGHDVRLFNRGKSEWDKQREHEIAMQDKYMQHEVNMAVGEHHSTVEVTEITTGSNERVANINAQAQIQAATMQAASAIKVAEYQALGLTEAARVDLLTGRELRQHHQVLAELDAETRKDIAYDTNRANITISANKLEAETIRIREQMEAELKLLREKQQLSFGESEWESEFEAQRLETEIAAHYKMMDSLDEEQRAAFMRRWYGRNRPDA